MKDIWKQQLSIVWRDFFCFQRCVDHILTFSWGSVQIIISQWCFSIKYVLSWWSCMGNFLVEISPCRPDLVPLYYSRPSSQFQCFSCRTKQCCLCMVICMGWPIFTMHVVKKIEAEILSFISFRSLNEWEFSRKIPNS